ncbi:MAG: ATP-dependent Clp protease proteolytic subunit [Deltaproteobacteria bacterium]|nr:ATP-dependent Clp protease proteolytic subunit [Deltaproteobacteria bacterium]MBI3389357.1 ATP-dependent Clp protease proteolytic subunit [Deltaproteobacteria bacterium]
MPVPKNEEHAKANESDSIMQKLLESRNLILGQEINDEVTQRMITQLLLLEAMDATKDIRLFINSPGGSADGGFAIFDAIRFIKPPVKTIAVGLVASAATIVLIAAKKEHRFAFSHCRLLIHQPSTQLHGSAADIDITAQEILKLRDKANQLIAAETGQTVQKVATDTNRDYWMGPDEGKKYGLIHKIVRTRDEL